MKEFRGVDLASSIAQASGARATYMRNFINENGVNSKRNGWEQLGYGLWNSNEIDGIFPININNKDFIIIAVGGEFYKAEKSKFNGYKYTKIAAPQKYEKGRRMCFVSKNRAYIIGGGAYLVFGTWDDANYVIKEVYDDIDTYIPTTTININKDGYEVGGAEIDTTAVVDVENMLSSRRKNGIVGDAADSTFTVDTKKIDEGTHVLVRGSVKGADDVVKEVEFSNLKDGAYGTELYDTSTNTSVGQIVWSTGKISFSVATNPISENTDNLTIEFSYDTGNRRQIENCSFGTRFGVGGNPDRLFLSGNPDFPNIDWHSDEEDFTYFRLDSSAVMGSESIPIMGYARLSDSTLIVYKKENSQEANLFFRTGEYVTSYESDGTTIKEIRGVFPVTAGAIGEGAVSPWANMTLVNDILMLSSNGVFGIELDSNVMSQQRYAKERSRFINAEITAIDDLSTAIAVVFKGKYYLAIEGKVYVADARYKSSVDGDMSDTFNYEWWVWDNMPVNVWAVVSGELWFGSTDGRICRMTTLEYADTVNLELRLGNATFSTEKSTITVMQGLLDQYVAGDRIVFNGGVTGYLLTQENMDGVREFVVDDGARTVTAVFLTAEGVERMLRLTGVEEVIVVNLSNASSESPFSEGMACTMVFDRVEGAFYLIDKNGDDLKITSESFDIAYILTQAQLCDVDYELSSFKVQSYYTNEVISLHHVDLTSGQSYAAIYHRENVIAEWRTPALNMGYNDYYKTLLGFSLTMGTYQNGELRVRWETKDAITERVANGIRFFSWDDIDFEAFTFETSFTGSDSKKTKMNFNYIVFSFCSDNDSGCSIDEFTIIYKVNNVNRGVR